MTTECLDALDASRAATPAFSAARSAFAAGRITADELHAARAAFNLARANFVAIHNAETAAAPCPVMTNRDDS